MKKILTGVTLCMILVLCLGNPVSAASINEWYGGDRVVYDTFSGSCWYSRLTNAVDVRRAQQSSYIVCLNTHFYGNRWGWDFATYDQMNGLKASLAALGTCVEHERSWTAPGAQHTVGPAFLAWSIQVDDHFVVSDYVTAGKFAKMTFNYELHYLPDDAKDSLDDSGKTVFPEPAGASIVSRTQQIPAPGALVLASLGVGIVGWLRRSRTL